MVMEDLYKVNSLDNAIQSSAITVSDRNGVKSRLQDNFCVLGSSLNARAVAYLLTSDNNKVIQLEDLSSVEGNFGIINKVEIRSRCGSHPLQQIKLDKEPESFSAGHVGFAIGNSGTVMICENSTNYGAITSLIAPHLIDGQVICLINAPLGAAFEFQHNLRKLDCNTRVVVMELGQLFSGVSLEENGQTLVIQGVHSRVSVGGLMRNGTRRHFPNISTLVKAIVPASNVIERGLSDVVRFVRPALAFAHLLSEDSFSFDPQSIKPTHTFSNPYSWQLIAGLEKEVQAVARSFGCVIPDFLRLFIEYPLYGEGHEVSPQNLKEAFCSHGTGLALGSENSLEVSARVLEADIAETLTLFESLASLSRTPVPVTRSIIDLASVMLQKPLANSGRTLETLGLVGFDLPEIIELINA